MGGGHGALRQDEEDISCFPAYYVKDASITENDVVLCRASWKLITDGTSSTYLETKSMDNNQSVSSVAYFCDKFYSRLFEILPQARELFKNNIQVQGRHLVGIVSTALNQLRDAGRVEQMLVGLAHAHSKYGVKAAQYGIFGDVLFWTLSTCLGSDMNEISLTAWVKLYSLMLKIIIPVAIMNDKQAISHES